jgi:hypothetical protein
MRDALSVAPLASALRYSLYLENEMDLWLIQKKDLGMEAPWGYDCYYAHVIRAESENDARRIASTVACDEGPSVWLDPSMTTCKPLTSTGEPVIILSDFLAG